MKIFGNVQGVGYRRWLYKLANGLGVTGWVKNCPDHTVEALIEGNEDAIYKIIEKCGEGPTLAEVERIEKQKVMPEGFEDFIIKRWN